MNFCCVVKLHNQLCSASLQAFERVLACGSHQSLLDPCFKSYALLRTSLCSISLVIFIPDHGVHLHSHHAKQHFILMCTCTRSTSKSKSVAYMLANLPCSPGHRFRNWAHLSPNPLSCLACCVIPPPRCCSIPPCPDPLHIRSC